MSYDYNFTDDENIILNKELKVLINSDNYKSLKKNYDLLVNAVSKQILNYRLKDPVVNALILIKNINNKFYNTNNTNNDDTLDLDLLFKIWGSRIFTGNYSNRHLVTFINDVLVRCGFISFKIFATKIDNKYEISDFYKSYYKEFDYKESNYILLCLIINDKKIFIDVNNGDILSYNKLYSLDNINCYTSIFNKKGYYYVFDKDYDKNLEINDDHLFTYSTEYLNACEFRKRDFKDKNIFEDYLEYLDIFNIDFLDINNYSMYNDVSNLNINISNLQNNIYKKVKKL